MNKRQAIIITFLSIIAFILALMVSDRFWFRLDLTKNKAYTISQVSRNLHREIFEPVSITYYVSDRLRSIFPTVGDIEDTLVEYTAYSRGKIRLTVKDPVNAGISRMVEELGLIPRQIQNVERDQASFTTVYSGIVIEKLSITDKKSKLYRLYGHIIEMEEYYKTEGKGEGIYTVMWNEP